MATRKKGLVDEALIKRAVTIKFFENPDKPALIEFSGMWRGYDVERAAALMYKQYKKYKSEVRKQMDAEKKAASEKLKEAANG